MMFVPRRFITPRHAGLAAVLMVALWIPASAHAEVMDKVPTLAWLWTWAACVTVATLVLGYVRWDLTAFAFPFTLVGVVAAVVELLDPHVGPAIWAEDPHYAILAWLGVMMQLLAHPTAIALGVARQRLAHRVERPHTF